MTNLITFEVLATDLIQQWLQMPGATGAGMQTEKSFVCTVMSFSTDASRSRTS